MYLISVKNVSLKYSKNRNNKALIYFAVNNHMYLILEDTVRKNICGKNKS